MSDQELKKQQHPSQPQTAPMQQQHFRRKAFSLNKRLEELKSQKVEKYRPLIEAHRGGVSIGVENSLPLFQKVIRRGLADSIEIDVYETKDEKLVVAHPDDDHALTKYGKPLGVFMHDFTLQELQKIDIGEGQRMPELGEVFALCKGKIFLSVELKPKSDTLVPRVLELVHTMDMWEEMALSSFEHELLAQVKTQMKEKYPTHKVEIQYLCEDIPAVEKVKSFEAAVISLDYHLPGFTPTYIAEIHALGVAVEVWPWVEEYGPDQKDYEMLASSGVDVINANNPILLRNEIMKQHPLPIRRKTDTLSKRVQYLRENPGVKLPPLIEAHRGGWLLGVENTLPLFQNALTHDFIDSVELDICETKDGKVMVIHPDKDHKMTKFGFQDGRMMHEFSAEEIAQINYEGHKIPTLKEVFEICKGKMFINIELKSWEKDLESNIGRLVLQEIEAMDMWEGVAISSFRLFLLDSLKKELAENPKYKGKKLGLMYLFEAEKFPSLEQVAGLEAADSINLNFFSKELCPDYIAEVHKLGVGVHVWFKVKSPELDELHYAKAVELGADIICVNQPVSLWHLLAR